MLNSYSGWALCAEGFMLEVTACPYFSLPALLLLAVALTLVLLSFPGVVSVANGIGTLLLVCFCPAAGVLGPSV